MSRLLCVPRKGYLFRTRGNEPGFGMGGGSFSRCVCIQACAQEMRKVVTRRKVSHCPSSILVHLLEPCYGLSRSTRKRKGGTRIDESYPNVPVPHPIFNRSFAGTWIQVPVASCDQRPLAIYSVPSQFFLTVVAASDLRPQSSILS